MAQADIERTLSIPIAKVFKAITSYEAYPDFLSGCDGAVVVRSGSEATVTYTVNLMKEISYTLKHREDPTAHAMSWELVESAFLKKNSGRWTLKALSEHETQIKYEIDIEFSIPVPGLILKGLIKGNLPKMVSEFEDYAKGL